MTTRTVISRAEWRLRVLRARERDASRFRTFSVLVVIAGLIALAASDSDMRALLGPIVAIVAAILLYFTVQIRRDGHMPIFEAATCFLTALGVYSIVPLVQYIAGGMQVTILSDNRTFIHAPTAQEYGGFAWRHVTLAWAFVLVYLPLRGKRLRPARRPVSPGRATVGVILVMMLGLTAWFLFLRLSFGLGETSVYQGGAAVESLGLPHVVLQISNVLQSVRIILKLCLVMILLLHWHRRGLRWLLAAWILAELAMTVTALEARTGTVILLLTCLIGYHLLVRPLRVAVAAMIGVVMLTAILIYGFARDIGSGASTADRQAVLSAANEFQVVYGTAYDLYRKRESHQLPPIPPQLFFADLYRLVPSQLLPFYKWDPSEWYMDVLYLRGTGQGLMFGVIAQAVIGYGYLELVLRGVLLAAFYAFAHRFYRRNSRSFWTTIAYLIMLLWAYYVVRSTSFEIFYRLVYYFLPTWAAVRALTMVVSKVRQPFQRSPMRVTAQTVK